MTETLFSRLEQEEAQNRTAECNPAPDEVHETVADIALPLDNEANEADIAEAEGDDEGALINEGYALTLSDVSVPKRGIGERFVRMAYGLGIPGHILTDPFRKPRPIRLESFAKSPLVGDRAAGTALRAGHFLIDGIKLPIAQVEFDSVSRSHHAFERTVHGFDWLRDLDACAPSLDCNSVAGRIFEQWIKANPAPGKGPAWTIERAGQRLLAWLLYAPLIQGPKETTPPRQLVNAIVVTANWLDRKVRKGDRGFAQCVGFAALTAAGLLLSDGAPRRLFAEAGLVKTLGELVAEDGGVLPRCPQAQFDMIALVGDVLACYEAAQIEAPRALTILRELMVPPLLALRHGDGALGSWQGQGAIRADRLAALLDASGVRTRPAKDVEHWGFQRMRAGSVIVQLDAAPPPKAMHARTACASTLAFEMSDGPHRIIVNCGGAYHSGGQVPARIGQALRATAAHSTLVLDNTNSTAVELHGKLGKGVETVEIKRQVLEAKGRSATRLCASHDGYAARFGLNHQRTLALSDQGQELAGQDVLVPTSNKGKRGKVGFAIRFHLGRSVEAQLTDDKRGANLLLSNGTLWQFRMLSQAEEALLAIEDSLWVDGDGRPHATHQLVIEGMVSRGGGEFAWLLSKMGQG